MRVEDFVDLNEPRLIVYTNSEQVNVVTYSSVILTTTFQAIDVDIELNLDYEFSPGEQLSFGLTFGIEDMLPTPLPEPEPIIVEPIVYNMEFGYIANNQTLTEGQLKLTKVNLMGDYIEMTDNLKSVLELTVNKGNVRLDLGLSGSQSNLRIFVNGVYTEEFRQWHDGVVNLTITEDNTIIGIVPNTTNRGWVRQITYTPE